MQLTTSRVIDPSLGCLMQLHGRDADQIQFLSSILELLQILQLGDDLLYRRSLTNPNLLSRLFQRDIAIEISDDLINELESVLDLHLRHVRITFVKLLTSARLQFGVFVPQPLPRLNYRRHMLRQHVADFQQTNSTVLHFKIFRISSSSKIIKDTVNLSGSITCTFTHNLLNIGTLNVLPRYFSLRSSILSFNKLSKFNDLLFNMIDLVFIKDQPTSSGACSPTN